MLPKPPKRSSLFTRSIVLTLFALLLTIMVFETTPLDTRVQDHFYNATQAQWLVNKNTAWANWIFYDGFKRLLILFLLSLVLLFILSFKVSALAPYRTRFGLVILAGISIPLLIGSLKAITNIPCPKDIQRYGGLYPHVTLLERYPDTYHPTKPQKCYPAGHASGGFALLALVFVFQRRQHRLAALATALTLGSLTGGYKMLIGDHFLSHTLITALIAWLVVLVLVKCLKLEGT